MKAIKIIGLVLSLQLLAAGLNAQEKKAELVVQTGNTDPVHSVALSPDGRTLASGSTGNAIKLWDVVSGKELRTLSQRGVLVAFSPGGKTLASGGSTGEKRIFLWEVSSGKELRRLAGHTDRVSSFAFSSDGKTLASGSRDKLIKLWDVATGKEIKTLTDTDPVYSIALSPDGKTLASGSQDNLKYLIKLWDIPSGKELKTLAGHKGWVYSVAFSPDGKTLASGSQDGTVKLWDVVSGNESDVLMNHTSFVDSVAFSPDGKMVISGSRDKTIKLWNVETGRETRTLLGHTKVVSTVAFSPDGKTLASGSEDTTIKLWDAMSGAELKTLTGHTAHIQSAALSPDGKILAWGSGDYTIKLWDLGSGKELKTLTGPNEAVNKLAFSPDSKILASGGGQFAGQGKIIRLWDVATGKEIKALTGHTATVDALAFSFDGKLLASSVADVFDKDGTIKLWDVASGKEHLSFIGHKGGADLVVFSTDGKTLASKGWSDGTIKLWDVATGKEIKSFGQFASNTPSRVSAVVPDFYRVSDNQLQTTDGRFRIEFGRSGKLDLFAVKPRKLLASMIAVGKEDWAVVTPDGLFDGTPAAWNNLIWLIDNNTFDNAPVEAFFKEFYRPGLLQDILAARKIDPPTQDLSQVDIRQPRVKVNLAGNQPIGPGTGRASDQRTVKVQVEIIDNQDNPRRDNFPRASGAQDVRLFRNGSLVHAWKGEALKDKHTVVLEATIPIIAGENRLTAYAFNHHNVKSPDAKLTVTGAESLKRRGIAHVLAIGIDIYSNPVYNLSYSVADAKAFGSEIGRWQQRVNRFERTELTTLLDQQATKANILGALKELKAKAQPEDAVMIYFAGHGIAEGKRFYLIPHDLGYAGTREEISTSNGLRTMLGHSISDRELEESVSGIDAGQMLFVIDACNSGQALEAEEKRRGPMNSAGLAQLAYEKGMYILTASQSFQFANESPVLGHGYLTYALVEQGLKSAAADGNGDGMVDVREWFVYATEQVPRIYEEQMQKKTDVQLAQLRSRKTRSGLDGVDDVQRPRVFYRREVDTSPLIVAVLGATSPQ